MATENPIRLVGSSDAHDWSSIFQTQSFYGSKNVTAPSRSGSAPPTIEGSSLAIGDLRGYRNSRLEGIFENLSNVADASESEEQLRSDPAYRAYYYSNVNLNPRLPQPLVSRENRQLVDIGSFGEKSKAFSTHKEEVEDDISGQHASSSQGRHKSIVDLIQEDFPRTPSPVYNNHSHLSSQDTIEQADPGKTDSGTGTVGVRYQTPSSLTSNLASLSVTSFDETADQQNRQHAESSTFYNVGNDIVNDSRQSGQYDQFSRSLPNLPSSVPLYATAAAYGSPYYAQTSSLFPQFRIAAGYTVNASLASPFITGYPPSIAPVTGVRSSLPIPIYMPYFQQPSVGTYGSAPSSNYDPLRGPRSAGNAPSRNIISGGTGSVFSGWQGQRGRDKVVDEHKTHNFLEELKSNKSRRYELRDIAGRIVEFSADQHGSRFIQQKLETCNAEEKASVFEEILPHASSLITDVFGNYVIQKFFEHGNPLQRKELANLLVGNILSLSLQMYGCRVIQKALEVIELDQKIQLVHELDGQVMRCVRDQNGNHVIQKCIECVPTEKIDFIISSLRGNVPALSMHPYGCRVIQRVLENCTNEHQSQSIVDEILQSACILAQDQYGNYVIQHVLERGRALERNQIISKLAGQIVQMSQHKFASNVIEKCLEYGTTEEQDILIEEIVGQTEGNDNLLVMMKDQFANYVVQKILDTCNIKQQEILLGRIKSHAQALRKYTYGKHIIARVEQLCGEDSHTWE